MKFIALFIFLILYIAQSLLAQGNEENKRFDRVDQHVTQVSKQLIFHPQLLVEKLTEGQTNDYDKVRAFYVWIARNVDYDLFAFYQKRKDYQSVNDVLGSGKALCSGYSLLFKYFCEQANIDARIIEGYAKGIGYEKKHKFVESNHAWNAVYIHGYWYLLDVTWATGDPRNIAKHRKKIDLNTYFLMPPEKLIKTHLSEDPTWQLLEKKVTLDEFENGDIQLDKATNQNFNTYHPSDYENINEYDREIIGYKRAALFNPRNQKLKQYLSFSYLYKGISLTDEIRDKDFIQLLDIAETMSRNFYSYMDSAWYTIEPVENGKMPRIKEIMIDEINYQKGVHNYEMGAELFTTAINEHVPPEQFDKKTEKYFEVAEGHFEKVPVTSIYLKDAKEYLSYIEDFRRKSIRQTPVD